jgi:hypothetical protein
VFVGHDRTATLKGIADTIKPDLPLAADRERVQ